MNGQVKFDWIEPTSLRAIIIPAPQTVLVTAHVTIAQGTILWPGTVLLADETSPLSIGEQAEIGFEGGFTIDARRSGGINIGNRVRLLGGGSLSGTNKIGDGAQILGAIRCQSCNLGAGGSHLEEDPDQRGAVLKGCGVARNITIEIGEVVQAFGLFADAAVRRQAEFHPKN